MTARRQEVVDTITAAGAPPPSTATTSARGRGEERGRPGGRGIRSLDILVNNAGILRDKMSFNMEESDWDDVIDALKGHFAPSHFAAVYWRAKAKRGEDVEGASSTRRRKPPLRQRRPGQLLGRQGGHRLDDLGARPRARALRRDRERHCAPCPHPHDRETSSGTWRPSATTASTSGTRRTSPSS